MWKEANLSGWKRQKGGTVLENVARTLFSNVFLIVKELLDIRKSRYRKARRDKLLENVILRRRYKRRTSPKNKRRQVVVRRGRGIGSTLDKILKKSS